MAISNSDLQKQKEVLDKAVENFKQAQTDLDVAIESGDSLKIEKAKANFEEKQLELNTQQRIYDELLIEYNSQEDKIDDFLGVIDNVSSNADRYKFMGRDINQDVDSLSKERDQLLKLETELNSAKTLLDFDRVTLELIESNVVINAWEKSGRPKEFNKLLDNTVNGFYLSRGYTEEPSVSSKQAVVSEEGDLKVVEEEKVVDEKEAISEVEYTFDISFEYEEILENLSAVLDKEGEKAYQSEKFKSINELNKTYSQQVEKRNDSYTTTLDRFNSSSDNVKNYQAIINPYLEQVALTERFVSSSVDYITPTSDAEIKSVSEAKTYGTSQGWVLTAKDAKTLTQSIEWSMEKVVEKIKAAALKGKTEIIVDNLSSPTIAVLDDMGYNLRFIDQEEKVIVGNANTGRRADFIKTQKIEISWLHPRTFKSASYEGYIGLKTK